MILGGAILKMNFRSQILMKLGNLFKYILPYLVLYRFFAFVIMPKKNHKNSRLLFINEAKKLYQKEFIKWFKLTAEINPVLRLFRQVELNIPTLYVMGEEDYMFLPSVRKVVENHYKTAQLFVVQNCGHVVNVEQPQIFNEAVIPFIHQNA
jgi:pimeloyl-ACP methyl ester carboxylesterase